MPLRYTINLIELTIINHDLKEYFLHTDQNHYKMNICYRKLKQDKICIYYTYAANYMKITNGRGLYN